VLGNFLWQVVAFIVIPFSLVQWTSRPANEMTVTLFVGIIESLIGGVVAWVFFAEPVTAKIYSVPLL
jgi:Mg/Co/Ni transporter MgtE